MVNLRFCCVIAGTLAALSLLQAQEPPRGSITGCVRTKDTNPIEGGIVAALRLGYFGEQRRYSLVQSTRTRTDGTYSLPELAAGKYYVVAFPSNRTAEERNAGDPSRAVQPIYYPFSDSAEDAIPVVVASGRETSTIDLTISDASVHSVCGNVEGLPDARPESLFVTLIRQGPEAAIVAPRKTALTTTKGSSNTFCFQKVPAGAYLVLLQGLFPASERKPAMTGSSALMVSTNDVTGVRILAEIAPRIEGTIHVAESPDRQEVYANLTAPLTIYNGDQLVSVETNPNVALLPVRTQPVNSETVAVVPGIPGNIDMRICLDPVDFFSDRLRPICAPVRNGGSFAVGATPSGHYRISAQDAPLGFFVKEVRFGGRQITSGELDIAGGSGGQLDVTLSPDGAFILGTVMDGKGHPAAASLVSLLPASESQVFDEGRVARTTTTGPDGRFAFWNLVPGAYFVWAWQELELPGLASRPSFLHTFPSRAVRIEAINPADPSYVVLMDFVPRDEVGRAGWQ